jgi:pimeloyl-ACP methyl ester carboxylesterase
MGFRAMSRAFAGDFSAILPIVSVPTLVVWGEADSRSPLGAGEAIRDGIRGAEMVVIPGAGHVSNMEQPERFNSEVRTFLQNLGD